ncbi:MAG: dihydrofolate reductase family protein [Pseudobacteriovorax sp.]|nr:dihydrofolate reductase family protein [Pseudobacteriovorax sp.]
MKIVNVMAMSLDGRIGLKKVEGDDERKQAGISSESDQEHLCSEIQKSDVIIVGASSIRANECCLDHHGVNGKPPLWIVLAEREIPEAYQFWRQTHIPRIIVSTNEIPSYSASVPVIHTTDIVSEVVELLKKQNSELALLFGGGIVNRMFYERQLVDELVLTIAPVIAGKSDAPYLVEPNLQSHVSLVLYESTAINSFLFLRYHITKAQ